MNSKLRKNQHGFHDIGIVLVVVVVIVIGLVAWMVIKKQSGPTLTSAQKTASSDCQKAYPDTNNKKVCDFYALSSYLTSTPYTMAFKVSDTSGTTTNLTIKSDGKGNIDEATPGGNLVLYNGTSYAKETSGTTWQKFTPGESGNPTITNPADSIKPKDFKGDAAKGIKFTYQGTMACGSQTCYKYQEFDPTQGGKGGQTTTFWFDNKNYQLQGFSAKDSTSTTNVVVTYGAVTIPQPSPVQ